MRTRPRVAVTPCLLAGALLLAGSAAATPPVTPLEQYLAAREAGRGEAARADVRREIARINEAQAAEGGRDPAAALEILRGDLLPGARAVARLRAGAWFDVDRDPRTEPADGGKVVVDNTPPTTTVTVSP